VCFLASCQAAYSSAVNHCDAVLRGATPLSHPVKRRRHGQNQESFNLLTSSGGCDVTVELSWEPKPLRQRKLRGSGTSLVPKKEVELELLVGRAAAKTGLHADILATFAAAGCWKYPMAAARASFKDLTSVTAKARHFRRPQLLH